jgi:hypothetical protein
VVLSAAQPHGRTFPAPTSVQIVGERSQLAHWRVVSIIR